MAQLNSNTENSQSFSRKRAGVRRMPKNNMRIDMTPMVDLGFLLITFFVVTTELNKPTVMDLAMTKDGSPMPIKESTALTILIDKANTIYYYEGKWEDAVRENSIQPIYQNKKNSLRTVINKMQVQIDGNDKIKEGRTGLMMLIKPGKEANYKTIIDILDEATINEVKKYAVLKQSNEEVDWLSKNQISIH